MSNFSLARTSSALCLVSDAFLDVLYAASSSCTTLFSVLLTFASVERNIFARVGGQVAVIIKTFIKNQTSAKNFYFI